jgi:preprotein translocase subunit SecG
LIVVLVLLQTGKGGSLAGVFGGGGGADSILGTRTTSFLVKATVVLSVIFLLLCLTLNRLGASARSRARYAPAPGAAEQAPPAEGEAQGVVEDAQVPAAGEGGDDEVAGEDAAGEPEGVGPPEPGGEGGEAPAGDGEAAGGPEGDDGERGAGAEE